MLSIRIVGSASGIVMASFLAGCTATDLASDPSLSLAVNDLQLPDTVEIVPTASGEPPHVVPVAYAGATPDEDTASPSLAALDTASSNITEASPLPDVKEDGQSSETDAADGAAVQVAALATGPVPPANQGLFGPPRKVEARSAELDALIVRYADYYGVPVALVRRVVNRESTFNPAARNGPYWGLMQIRHDTARTMGYRGSAEGLLDAETNLRFAVRYLRGAYITAGGNQDRAVRHYAAGYYYHARDKGLLEVTGLR